jgi:two-component system, OmpR family, response regulator VicR
MKESAKLVQRRILVVDDEPLVCDAVKMMLTFEGHLVETANNGEQALAKFESGKFDLVITDFEMPLMKGDQLAAAIKERAPKQPILLLTAYGEAIRGSDRDLSNIDLIVDKPFRLDALREGMAKVLGQKDGGS